MKDMKTVYTLMPIVCTWECVCWIRFTVVFKSFFYGDINFFLADLILSFCKEFPDGYQNKRTENNWIWQLTRFLFYDHIKQCDKIVKLTTSTLFYFTITLSNVTCDNNVKLTTNTLFFLFYDHIKQCDINVKLRQLSHFFFILRSH